MAHASTEPGALREHYDTVFGQPWPVIPAALLVGTLNVFLFAFDRPWTASDGFRNWGDWLLQSLGLLHRPDLVSPFLYSGSILNLGLLMGALAAALLESRVRYQSGAFGGAVKGRRRWSPYGARREPRLRL